MAFAIFSGVLFSEAALGVKTEENSLQEVLLVANNMGGTVSVISIPSYEVLYELDVKPDIEERRKEWNPMHRAVNQSVGLKYADDLRVSLDGKVLYVSRASLSDVAAFSFADRKLLWRVPIEGYRADHMTLSKDGKYLFVAALLAAKVQVIDTQQKKVVGSFATGALPHVIAMSWDDKKVFVGEIRGNGVTIADAKTFKVIRRIDFEEGVRPFDLTRDGRTLYVQLSKFHGFLEYDLKKNRIRKTINLPETDKSRSFNGNYPKDAAHHGLSLSLDEKMMCIAGTSSDYVALVSRPGLKQLALIPAGEQPSWAIQSLDGKFCYVSSRESDTVSVISYDELSEVRRIKVGDYPQRMFTAKIPVAF